MDEYVCDIFAINETGLNGDEYVEVINLYRWVGTNSDWSKRKSGGDGFIMKADGRHEQVMCDCEDSSFIKMVMVNKAKFEGLKILFGGDMNVHIWELDRCENGNGRLLKQLAGDLGLQIMNCVWKGRSEATWFMDNRKFTQDYVGIDRVGLACVVEAVIMDEVAVVYCDHEYRMEGKNKNKERKESV